jgi:hypothetical protein
MRTKYLFWGGVGVACGALVTCRRGLPTPCQTPVLRLVTLHGYYIVRVVDPRWADLRSYCALGMKFRALELVESFLIA